MNSLYIKTFTLLSGQSAPFTGAWVNIAQGRDALFTAYSSGTGGINLQYQSPFFPSDGITYYTWSQMTTGYGESSFQQSPMTHIRAVCSGSGSFWCAATIQN